MMIIKIDPSETFGSNVYKPVNNTSIFVRIVLLKLFCRTVNIIAYTKTTLVKIGINVLPILAQTSLS